MKIRPRPQRRHVVAAVAACLSIATVAACSSGDDASASAGADEAPETAGSFDTLLAEAEGSDHVVRLAISGETPEVLEAREAAFEERFGFPLELEIEPGHGSREIPAKITQAAASGDGIVDLVVGTTSHYFGLFDQNRFAPPDWEALEEEWPLIADLREAMIDVENEAGDPMDDYCLLQAEAPWVPFYNTDNVDASEFEGFEWEDLPDERWQGRLVWDVEASGLFVFPYAEGWDEDRLASYTADLGALDPTLVPGGSAGAIQAVLQGEGDVGVAVQNQIAAAIAEGAPLAYVIPEDFLPISNRSGCLIDPAPDNRAMASLYLGWYTAERQYEEATDAASGGWQRLLEDEAEHFPLAAEVTEAGLTREDLAYPTSREEEALQEGYREVAKEGLGS